MDVLKMETSKLTLALDAMRPSDNTEILNAGCELDLMKMVALRAGYKSLFREDSEEGLTLGAGFHFTVPDMATLTIDYTLADFGILENIHMASVGIQF
jgi:hypothetical protein